MIPGVFKDSRETDDQIKTQEDTNPNPLTPGTFFSCLPDIKLSHVNFSANKHLSATYANAAS